MHSVVVLLLCLRVIDCDVSDWLDLPELTSIQMGEDALMFCMDGGGNELIMQSDEMNVNWRTRFTQTHNTHNIHNIHDKRMWLL